MNPDTGKFEEVTEELVLPIVQFPEKVLWEKSIPIEDITEETLTLIKKMRVTMAGARGIGLAAVQVGVPLQLFIVSADLLGGAKNDDPVVFINPKITQRSKEKEARYEGCLSLPWVDVKVRRPKSIRVEAYSPSSTKFELELEGDAARAVLHEYDHLRGWTIYDHASPAKKTKIVKRLVRGNPPHWIKRKR